MIRYVICLAILVGCGQEEEVATLHEKALEVQWSVTILNQISTEMSAQKSVWSKALKINSVG